MSHRFTLLFAIVILSLSVSAQHQVQVISRCGGTETVTIPTIIDADGDGMDDRLEQMLLNKFMPKVIQFSDESCPGPALDGTGDSNLIVCHIYPLPQQYTRSNSYDSILTHPVAIVPARGLVPGLIWYNTLIKVNTAILYGKDCGALGHTADVEGFNFSMKYTGPDTLAGWMYDTVLSLWKGDTIQTVSHAGTPCQQIEVRPMKSLYVSWGADSIYASPDKHGNYLTTGGCGASFICNPGCGNAKRFQHVRNINIGEPGASLIADLGSAYAPYAGNDPWSTANFLAAQSGNAGAIRDKMILPMSSTFIHGQVLTAAQICPLYARCYGPIARAISAETCAGTAYQFRTRSLTQSGTYRDTVGTGYGCDSVVTLSLTVYSIDTHTVQTAVCHGGSYTFHGQVLTAGGIYHDTLTDTHGCDSIVQLLFSVRPQPVSAYSAVSCDTAYTFHGRVLGSSGVYSDTLADMYSCDSIVTLSLTIDSIAPPVWSSTGDTVLAHSHAILLDARPVGGVYTGAGVRGNVFYVDSVSPGSHQITYSCTDSMGCTRSAVRTITVVTAGISEAEIADQIMLYPNPAIDMITMESALFIAGRPAISVYDVVGKVSTISYTHQAQYIHITCSSLPAGIYWIKISLDGKSVTKRFIKALQ